MTTNSSSDEFNEPEFKDYDPTPYGGGYDLSLTYGNPLPPSTAICYPRSSSSAPPPQFPYGHHPIDDDHSSDHNNSTQPHNWLNDEPPFSHNSYPGKQDQEQEQDAYDYSPWFKNGYENGYGYGYPIPNEENGYDYGFGSQEKENPQTPCDTLFGYLPCLSKAYQKTHTQQDQGHGNEWKGTEDYFFGTSYPYPYPYDDGETRDSYGYPNYGYQTHYLEQQPSYTCVQEDEYNHHLLSQNLNYYEAYPQ